MTKVQLRNVWFQIHKWIGIILAIIFIPLSFTGSMLVWDEPLDRLLQPSHYAETGPAALPASAYVAAARQSLPAGSTIVSLAIGKGPVMVTATPPQPSKMRGPPLRLAAWIDPATGRLIDSGLSASPVLRWAHIFHGSLQIPGSGRAVVGWLGVLMLISSLTGIWLWWPLSGRWTRGFRWQRQPALDANLHHMIGFWISLPLALLSLTGVIIAWPQMMGGGGMRRPMSAPLATPQLTVDRALTAASVKGPVTITWPTDKTPWTIKPARGAPVKIDDATGTLATADNKPEPPRARPLYRRLHDGTNMGVIFQIVIFLAGIAPAILGVTGIIMWLRTRKWRGQVAQRRAGVRG
ncbi:PepSY-associated TM helix domain-containing protein [Sphingomonas crusticola]|uniref:PepSY-associated TM helix domain-containing protein n=1 Tax=Sphingomonas crusticola TaxID=1697973 RepID=UPI000E228E68|nr:PepSY-associated TM helix domain-containing protein [Sphingomonas crusticola]